MAIGRMRRLAARLGNGRPAHRIEEVGMARGEGERDPWFTLKWTVAGTRAT